MVAMAPPVCRNGQIGSRPKELLSFGDSKKKSLRWPVNRTVSTSFGHFLFGVIFERGYRFALAKGPLFILIFSKAHAAFCSTQYKALQLSARLEDGRDRRPFRDGHYDTRLMVVAFRGAM